MMSVYFVSSGSGENVVLSRPTGNSGRNVGDYRMSGDIVVSFVYSQFGESMAAMGQQMCCSGKNLVEADYKALG